jgi:hypothetical protein
MKASTICSSCRTDGLELVEPGVTDIARVRHKKEIASSLPALRGECGVPDRPDRHASADERREGQRSCIAAATCACRCAQKGGNLVGQLVTLPRESQA